MKEDELLNNEVQEPENLEETKEVHTLEDLSMTALHQLEDEYDTEEFADASDDANLIFKTVVDTKEEMAKEAEEKIEALTEKKEHWWNKLSQKFNQLPKKKKIILICSICLVLLLILGLVLYLILKPSNPNVPEGPSVVIEMDNYRYENGSLIFLSHDQEIGRYECQNKDENLCKMAVINNDDNFLGAKNVDENNDPLILNTNIYYDRYVFVVDHNNEKDESIFLYDLKNNEIIETVFAVKTYQEYANYIVLKNDQSKYGVFYLNEEDLETIIPYTYDALGLVSNNSDTPTYAVVKDHNNYYLASMENKILTKAVTDNIVYANDKHLVTLNSENKYDVRDYEMNILNETPYDYIYPLENYMLYVNDEKLFVADYENNPMLIDGLTLKNKYYDPVNVYENFELKETKKAFDYELTDNLLNINVYNNTEYENYSINLLEGELSKTLAFMNYFEGNLYFYSDEEKTTLIGQYPCSNKNNLAKDNLALSSCKLANESFYRETTGNTKEKDQTANLGTLPIINNQYVFILDGNEIKLYDLINAKEKAQYKGVDTSSYTNTSAVSFRNASELYFIAASNASGRYGVAKITSDGVSPVIPFEYQSIKWLGEYLVVQDNNGYVLKDIDNNTLTSAKQGAIVDYLEVDSTHKYLKTYKDNMYFVHKYEDDLNNTSYNYIELYKEYYAAVFNNRVHLYRYDDEKLTEYIYDEKDEEAGIELKTNNYYGDGTKSFVISFNQNQIEVQIGNTNNTYTKHGPFSTTIKGENNNEGSEKPDESQN